MSALLNEGTPPQDIHGDVLLAQVKKTSFEGIRFPSFCEIGTGSSPGVGEPLPHSVLVNSTVLPSVSPPPHSVRVLLQLARLPRTRSNHVQITKIISKANEDQREKGWAKGLSQGLGQGSHLRPLAEGSPPHSFLP